MTRADTESPQHPIRVLVASMPALLVHIVTRSIMQEHDMALVAQDIEQDDQDPLTLLFRAGPDVDVLVMSALQVYPLPGVCSHLLSEYPDLRILVLSPSGDAAMLYWRGLRRQELTPFSPRTLLDGIRWAHALNPATEHVSIDDRR